MRRAELNRTYDIAVAGSGFAGSLMAMIARRLGYTVVMIERGRHPRVVIGESSTPLANLLLEELCRRYDLPAIAPLAKWGTWQRQYPEIGCGLKRGFTFYHHSFGEASDPQEDHSRQLLVAASPHDGIADTHWYRADVDAFLVKQAQQIGVDYLDETQVESVEAEAHRVCLTGVRDGEPFSLQARFVVDATGPRGLLHGFLRLGEEEFPHYPHTQALWSHFRGVERPARTGLGKPPYPAEDAAVHHLFDGGWIWVLHFNNGVTSAGVAATDELAGLLRLSEGESAWRRLLAKMPPLEQQFADARCVRPFGYIPRVSCLSARVVGERWALLPSAAGFVDPLLSTGFPLVLLGIERMARVLEAGLDSAELPCALEEYQRTTKAELCATAELVGALYRSMHDFALLRALTLLYFAAASYSETARRLGKAQLAGSFLLHQHPEFGPAMRSILAKVHRGGVATDSPRILEDVRHAIEPIDVAGLNKPNLRHWYGIDGNDLLHACAKVEATPEEVVQLLERSGFHLTAKAGASFNEAVKGEEFRRD